MRAPFLPPPRPRPQALPYAATAAPGGFALYALLAFAVFLLVAYWDQRDETDDQQDYCAAVYSGRIPDWRHTYTQSCRLGKLKKY